MRCEPEQRVCAAQRNGQPQAGGESPERSETNPSLSAICLEIQSVTTVCISGLLVADPAPSITAKRVQNLHHSLSILRDIVIGISIDEVFAKLYWKEAY